MPKPTDDLTAVPRHSCEHASEIRLVDVRFRIMTVEEDREAVATVAALIRALHRAGHHPPTTPVEGGSGA